jgi:hypothetical protein
MSIISREDEVHGQWLHSDHWPPGLLGRVCPPTQMGAKRG